LVGFFSGGREFWISWGGKTREPFIFAVTLPVPDKDVDIFVCLILVFMSKKGLTNLLEGNNCLILSVLALPLAV